jgi:hypothetical protein
MSLMIWRDYIMFEQDYIMRQIKEITAVIAKVVFNAKVDKSFETLQEVEKQKAYTLIEQMNNGKIKEAVEELDKLTEENTIENLMIGLSFYSHLSDLDEEQFELAAYTFAQGRSDFERFANKFGWKGVTDLYFGNDDD